jgi:hypothetical protein
MQVCLLRDDELLSSYDDNLHRLSVAVVNLDPQMLLSGTLSYLGTVTKYMYRALLTRVTPRSHPQPPPPRSFPFLPPPPLTRLPEHV